MRNMAQKDKIRSIEKPEMPIGTLHGQDIDDFFNKSIAYHKEVFENTLSEYEPFDLYSNWKTFVRNLDEFINIPFEIDIDDKKKYLSLGLNLMEENNLPNFKYILDLLENKFNKKISQRFMQIAMMSSAINASYIKCGVYNLQGNSLNLDNIENAIDFFQSRRLYYVSVLPLIPQMAKGSKKIKYIDLLNFFQYCIDSCLVGITSAYFKLLINKCISDYEITSDGTIAKGNFDFSHLESFFLEPERLSLLDQLELRPDIVIQKTMLPKSDNKIFSFSETANAMSLYEGAFHKYKLDKSSIFKELSLFLYDIAIYIEDDFNIVIEETDFEKISQKYKSLKLSIQTTDYFVALNSKAPFQKVGNYYFSTVVLLTRFVTNTLSTSLLKNRTFQIHSGFVFEDKVASILKKFNFELTDIKRINRKEFDLVTIKNGEIYNFQCKNNYYDSSTVDLDYNKIAKLNNRLCNYYEKALTKEINRENLIKDKLGIQQIYHFVISRYPVITRNEKIINFNRLENWLIDKNLI